MSGEKPWSGEERRSSARYDRWWRIGMTVWLTIFTLIVFFSLYKIDQQSVRVDQIHETNCGLEKFLLAARKARWDSFLKKNSQVDLNAVYAYEHILLPFHQSDGRCYIPQNLLIPSRPLEALRR